MTPHQRRLSQMHEIAEEHGVSLPKLFSGRRIPEIVNARRAIARRLYEHEKMNVSQIGRILKIHRTSALHFIRKDGWTPESRAAQGQRNLRRMGVVK